MCNVYHWYVGISNNPPTQLIQYNHQIDHRTNSYYTLVNTCRMAKKFGVLQFGKFTLKLLQNQVHVLYQAKFYQN